MTYLPKAAQLLGGGESGTRHRKPLYRMEIERLGETKSWNRRHKWKIHPQRLMRTEKQRKVLSTSHKKEVKKNIRNESSSQILRAETIFNPRDLGIRRTENWRKARFPTSPRIRFLIGHCTIVTWSLLEPKINTSNKRTKEKQKEFLLTENSSQITSTL